MKLTYHGHSIVKIEANGQTVLIDPFINGNSLTDLVADEVKADIIILTHGHNDHVGDTVEIAKRNNSTVVACSELATLLSKKGVNVHPVSIGGTFTSDFGSVKFTQAIHGSGYNDEETGLTLYTGLAGGLLLFVEGKTIYHAGDTALFGDMKIIGELNNVDLAFLPIGDNFTMGPADAAIAAEWVGAKKAIPIHYDTFPFIRQNPQDFISKLKSAEGYIPAIGENISI